MVVMTDTELIDHFIQAASEFITYSSQGFQHIVGNVSASDLGVHASPWKASVKDSYEVSEYMDEDTPEVWPPGTDLKLTAAVKRFQIAGGVSDGAAKLHLCLLWVLQLRTQCGLRGIKPSELFGKNYLATMCQSLENEVKTDLGTWTKSHLELPSNSGSKLQPLSEGIHSLSENLSLQRIREEFILQCFRRLESKPAHLVYNMAAVWDFDPQRVKLLHLSTLLELGLDELIGELISQVLYYYS
jgi:hypothetical protein